MHWYCLKLSLFGSFLLHTGIVTLQLCLCSADFLYFVLHAYRRSKLLKNSQMVFRCLCKIVIAAYCQMHLKVSAQIIITPFRDITMLTLKCCHCFQLHSQRYIQYKDSQINWIPSLSLQPTVTWGADC